MNLLHKRPWVLRLVPEKGKRRKRRERKRKEKRRKERKKTRDEMGEKQAVIIF